MKTREEIDIKAVGVSIVAIVIVIAILWMGFVYPETKAKEIRTEFGDDFSFEIEWEVEQIGNNSALLYLTTELPEEFDNSNNRVGVMVTGIEDSFNQYYSSDLFLGTYDDLVFVRDGNKYQNCLIVPNGERLSVGVKIYSSTNKIGVESKTIEVIT